MQAPVKSVAETPNAEMKNILMDLDLKNMGDFDGRDKAYWIQRVGEVRFND